ncbi:GntR family transcriptional regulator [Phenylobacterium sp.]|uniref:GntR family transcriptional regulator n=1 Tax=Phenylobacterium sp. TaxID=1871053 RepID=UPI0025FBC95D|nr:GntR family transcriptional regulator [Phenylobacterium sp.]
MGIAVSPDTPLAALVSRIVNNKRDCQQYGQERHCGLDLFEREGLNLADSKADRIAQEIVAKIQRGALSTGDWLREHALADEFGVSRGPVREALRILAASYWVTLEAGRGAQVAGAGDEPDLDAVLVAGALLGVAGRLAAIHATSQDCQEIEGLAQRIADAAVSGAEAEAFRDLTFRLGARIVEASRNDRLREYVGAFSTSGFNRIAAGGVVGRSLQIEAARCWADIALAIRRKDGRTAETLLRERVERGLEAIHQRSLHPGLWDD